MTSHDACDRRINALEGERDAYRRALEDVVLFGEQHGENWSVDIAVRALDGEA